jgi:hypothetical protein
MATAVESRAAGCDGFRVESPKGLVGWVEETWRGATGETVALAVRTIDGRRGLLLVEDTETVLAESEELIVGSHSALLELDAPRVEAIVGDGGGPAVASASWRTTGATLELAPPPGALRQAMLMLRPWRLAPPPPRGEERAVWQTIGLLYTGIAVLIAVEIGLAFLVAYLVAGQAV